MMGVGISTGGRGSELVSPDTMFWLPGQNTTIGMPTPLNGHGRIRRCADGSLNMPPEFSAGFHAGDTSSTGRLTQMSCGCEDGVSGLSRRSPLSATIPPIRPAHDLLGRSDPAVRRRRLRPGDCDGEAD